VKGWEGWNEVEDEEIGEGEVGEVEEEETRM
jgi:hypothetical protein